MSRAARRLGAVVLAGLGAAAFAMLHAAVARAATDSPIPAEIQFEIGPYNAAAGDWPITALQLRGGLLDGKRADVALEGVGGATLWEGEIDFTSPMTRLVVDRFVPVGAVARVSLAQEGFPVAVAPVVTENPSPASPATPPEVRSEVVTLPPPQASPSVRGVAFTGSASAPRLAVSLIVLLVMFAVVFRLPLFSAGSQTRWRP
jgi:hypothetical protein